MNFPAKISDLYAILDNVRVYGNIDEAPQDAEPFVYSQFLPYKRDGSIDSERLNYAGMAFSGVLGKKKRRTLSSLIPELCESALWLSDYFKDDDSNLRRKFQNAERLSKLNKINNFPHVISLVKNDKDSVVGYLYCNPTGERLKEIRERTPSDRYNARKIIETLDNINYKLCFMRNRLEENSAYHGNITPETVIARHIDGSITSVYIIEPEPLTRDGVKELQARDSRDIDKIIRTNNRIVYRHKRTFF